MLLHSLFQQYTILLILCLLRLMVIWYCCYDGHVVSSALLQRKEEGRKMMENRGLRISHIFKRDGWCYERRYEGVFVALFVQQLTSTDRSL